MADEPEAGRDDDAGGEGTTGDGERPERDEHGRSVPPDDGSEGSSEDGSSDGRDDESSVAGDGDEDDDEASSADGAGAASDTEETDDDDDADDDADTDAEGVDDETDTGADAESKNDADAKGSNDAEGEAEETGNEIDADGDVTDTEVDDGSTDEDERSGSLQPASDDETGSEDRRDEDGENDEDDEPVPETDDSEDGNGKSDSTDESDDHDEAGEADGERDESDDDPDFPVKGMSAEEATWDPKEATDAEDLAVDEDPVEPTDGANADVVGVQPEKQEIDDSFWGEGPESDQEMPLADHIEEMMRRLGVVFLIGGTVTLVVLGLAQTVEWLPTAVDIIDALWNHNIPNAPEDAGRRPRVYGPLELILTKLKVAGLAGLLVGLPAFVYETYLFMRPGLYPRERKYYLAAVPTSLVLGVIGMTFAHFVVLPVIFDYFTTYTQDTGVTVAFGLAETFNLIILLMGYMAIVFQIPLFIMLAIMMNLVTRLWLEDKRLLFWGAFAGLAFLVSPDPTGMAPIIVAATMIVLYEGTLALLRWTGN